MDSWVGSANLPFRLDLTDEGIRLTAKIGGLKVVNVLTALTVFEGWLRLRPIEAVGRSLPDVIGAAFTGNLPLPTLPEEAGLLDVEHREGSMVATVSLTELDESLDPGLAGRLRTRLQKVESGW
jgi:hypothetical protein